MSHRHRILCVYHATQRDDRVSRMLVRRGFKLDWVNPARGEALPDDGEQYLAAVVYGGEQSVNDDTGPMLAERRWIARWLADGRACLGLCLGAQLIAQSLGARVSRHAQGLLENGYMQIQPEAAGNALFSRPMHVFQWHNEGFDLPPGCERLARGRRFENQAFRHAPHIIGLQFHPEVTPEIMFQWFCEGGHMLTDPGARDAEAQLRDARVFEPAIETWTAGFLDQWIDCSIEAQRKPMHNHA